MTIAGAPVMICMLLALVFTVTWVTCESFSSTPIYAPDIWRKLAGVAYLLMCIMSFLCALSVLWLAGCMIYFMVV